jgi:hypothetical protein
MKNAIQTRIPRAEEFARAWLAAWNSHSIDAVMEHYAPDVTVQSPFLAEAVPGSGGSVTGRDALRAIYAKAFLKYPALRFDVIRVLAGTESLVIHYRSVEDLYAAETFLLDDAGKARLVLCHYSLP